MRFLSWAMSDISTVLIIEDKKIEYPSFDSKRLFENISSILWFVSFLFMNLKLGNNFNLTEVALAVLATIISIIFIFVFCECGEMVNQQFSTFNKEFCQCNWYLFPHEMQQMFVLFMSGTNQPMQICGYANTKFTRKMFKRVISCRIIITQISRVLLNVNK